MDRRAFLATGVATVTAGTAGCSSILGKNRVRLSDPAIETQDGGTEKYLVYRHDGDRILTLGVDQRDLPASLTGRFGFRFTASHSDATQIDSFQFDVRAPTGTDPPADLYLQSSPGELWTDFTYEVVEDGWTRVAVEDTGSLGDGTLMVETIVAPTRAPAEDVGLRAEMTLSDDSAVYELDDRTSFHPLVL